MGNIVLPGRTGKQRDSASVDALSQQLEWIADFCDRCVAALEIDNLSEMTRMRDDLAQALRDRQTLEAQSKRSNTSAHP